MTSPTTRSKFPKASKKRKKKSPKKTSSPERARRPLPVFVALGSNLGDSRAILAGALQSLARLIGPLRVAPFYRSEPVSDIAQPAYWNTVAAGRTALPAEALLAALQRIERRFGRDRTPGGPAGAPRTLDLDLLLLGRVVRRRRAPLLPHPRLRQRRFVLQPLADLSPDLALPPDGSTPAELLRRLPPRPWVRREP